MSQLRALSPLGAGVLLKRVEIPDKLVATEQHENLTVLRVNHLVIPDIAQKPVHCGQVVATGPGRLTAKGYRIPISVKEGDIVWYQTSDADDGEHILIQEADILGIVSEA